MLRKRLFFLFCFGLLLTAPVFAQDETPNFMTPAAFEVATLVQSRYRTLISRWCVPDKPPQYNNYSKLS